MIFSIFGISWEKNVVERPKVITTFEYMYVNELSATLVWNTELFNIEVSTFTSSNGNLFHKTSFPCFLFEVDVQIQIV